MERATAPSCSSCAPEEPSSFFGSPGPAPTDSAGAAAAATTAHPDRAVLDELVGLAAEIAEMPMGVLAVSEGDRQRFIAAFGIGISDAAIDGPAFKAILERPGLSTLADGGAGTLLPGVDGICHAIGVRLEGPGAPQMGALCLYGRRAPATPLTERQERMLLTVARQILSWLRVGRIRAERQRLDEAQRIAQQAANVGIYISDEDGSAICSPEFYQQLGLPEDTPLVGRRWLDLVHPADRAHVDETLQAAILNGEQFECDFRVIRADTGDIRWLSSRSRIERDAQGNALRAIGANIDVTDRKLAQAEAEEGRNLLRSVIDQSSDTIFVKDLNHRFVLASAKSERTMGLPASQIVGRTTRELFPAGMAENIERMDSAVIESGQPALFEREAVIDGQTRVLQTSAIPWERDGAICGLVAISRDITDQKHAERALRDSEERFRLAAQAAGLGIWDYDGVSNTRRFSDDLLGMLGMPAGTPPDLSLARTLIHADDRDAFDAVVAGAHNGDPDFRFEATMRVSRGDTADERWITTNGWKTVGPAGDLIRVIVTVRDVTEQKTAEERVRWTANHDPLTGLPNRLCFQEAIARAVAVVDPPQRFGLLLVDVDHFKQVNDTLGHDAGDALLKSLGERLCSAFRSTDMVARLGGDEFAVILNGLADHRELEELARRAIERLREPFQYKGNVIDGRASMGATLYPDDAVSIEVLLKEADTALYAAKAAGRGKLVLFRPEMMAEHQNRSSMLLMAREALENDRIEPFYQPKVELSTGRLIGFEALLRWWKPGAGIQRPAEILAAFDDIELANGLSDRMFDKTIADIRAWRDAGLAFGHVAVNASAAEFRSDDFAERVLARLDAASVFATCMEIEVTETVFMGREGEFVQKALDTLCAAGVNIALDDFGTGYASLSHLKQFPVDTIKIDRSFLPGLTEDADDAAIVRAVLRLGQSLGIRVVAEGIETRSQAQYLREHGCDLGQGYLFGRPMAASRIPKLITGWDAERWRS